MKPQLWNLIATSLCLVFSLDYSNALLRANENIHDDSDSHLPSPTELFKAVDPPNCPTEPIYHDLRSTKHPVMADLIEKRRVWYEEDYLPHKHLGTFVSAKEELFVTLPKGSKFVYWKQEGGVDGVFTPVLKMSAWYEDKNDTVIAHTGQTSADTYTWNFIDPKKMDHNLNQKKITLEGDYAVWITGWFFQYQHLLIDHLGYLVYLSKVLPPTTRILMPRVGAIPLFYSMILRVDQTLADRIDFISCQDYVHCYNQMFEFVSGSLTILTPRLSTRHLELYEMVRSWLWNSSRINATVRRDVQKTVVYYKRSEGGAGILKTLNSRYMDAKQEEEIVERIQHALTRYNRPEKLVIFDGKLSFIEQVQLFSSASAVIGPHGGGLANILLASPPSSCEDRTKVLEFVTSSATPKVQRGDIIASYYTLYSTCPWVELHQVLFTPQSGYGITYINMDAFDKAIKIMFSGESNVSPSRTTYTRSHV